jgi:probable HAF family extracellular repeat protein
MAYNILDLGALNKNLSVGFAITNCGQVAGWVDSPIPPNTIGAPIPFVWAQGVMQLLPLTGRAVSGQAFDLNGQGQVVGNIYNTVVTQPTRWQGGLMQLLPFSGDDSNGWSINDCGSVAGDGGTATNANIQAWCDPGGRLNPLPSNNSQILPADRYSRAYGINNRGQIVGGSDLGTVIVHLVAFAAPPVGTHACLWDKGIAKDIGTLHANEGSEAYGINDKTQIVGRSGNHAFLWHNGAMTDLGGGAAYNINNNGAVIGDSFLWQGGARTALTALLPPNSGWASLQGRDINDYGEIVGTGVHNGNTRAFLMWP